MLYDFTYTWNTNKKTKYIVRENILVLARGERSEIGEGSPVKKSINQPGKCNVQHGNYS